MSTLLRTFTAATPVAPVEVTDDTDGVLAVRFPVLALEGMDTGDGRYIVPGQVDHRALPISLLAQPYSSHGGQEPPPAVVIGSITELTRHPGPDVVSPRTGEPYTDDVWVWSAKGEIDGSHEYAELVRNKWLRGVSVDLTGLDAELVSAEDAALSDNPRREVIVHSGRIAAATMVPIPAFDDAYGEVDDEDAPPALVAAADLPDGILTDRIPAWRSSELGDRSPWGTTSLVAAAAAESEHTGGMVALVPAPEDAIKLAVAGGAPAGELHLTLAYLGDDVSGWDDRMRDAVHEVAREYTDPATDDGPEVSPYQPGYDGPLQLQVFSWSQFNPNGGPQDQEPCLVYQFSGDGDLDKVENLAMEIRSHLRSVLGELNFPEQHPRFEPHVTAGFGLPPDALSYTGPVRFDRIRVELGGEVTDFPLGGGGAGVDAARAMVASVSAEQRQKAKQDGDTYPGTDAFPVSTKDQAKAAVGLAGNSKEISPAKVRKWLMRKLTKKGWQDLIPDTWRPDGSVGTAVTASAAVDLYPPLAWFAENTATGETPITITEDGRVFGHIAVWSRPHISFTGQRIYARPSASDYAFFNVGAVRCADQDGTVRLAAVGHLTMDTSHPDLSLTAASATRHYDHTGYAWADVAAMDDTWGVWVAGRVKPGIPREKIEFALAHPPSGDWRPIDGRLELVAALCVNTPGIPVPRARVASGQVMALVAAGALAPAPPKESATPDGQWDAAALDAFADAIVQRMEARAEQRAALTAQHLELLADTDDTTWLAQQRDALLAETDDEDDEAQFWAHLADLTDEDGAFDISRMPPQLQKSYLTGKVAARIKWGVPGDFKRCVTQAKIHGMGHKAEGACATLHHKKLGVWPGGEHGKGGKG